MVLELTKAQAELAVVQQALEEHKRRRNLSPDWWTDLRELQGQLARLSLRVRELSELEGQRGVRSS